MPRLPKKRTNVLAYEEEKGKLKARRLDKKKVNMEVWIREQIEKLIDKIDPLELFAVAAGTIIVHDVIFKADEFVRNLEKWQNSPNPIIAGLALSGIAGSGSVGIEIAYQILKVIAPERAEKLKGEQAEKVNPTLTEELMLWLIAFAIAYYCFKHKEQLLGTAKMFFAMI